MSLERIHDADLRAVQDARDCVGRASRAQQIYRDFDQARVDRVCEAVVRAARSQSARLARVAVEETGYGDVESKTRKNLFASVDVWESIRELQTVGTLHHDVERGVAEIAEPYGVVLAVVPVTNPTSTALFKILIALKTRNALVVSPHPRAKRCISAVCEIARAAVAAAGAPPDVVTCLQDPTLESTQAAMRAKKTALILATGGPGLVEAAYSSGKPALGVGPGNTPAYIDRSADPDLAAEAVVQSQLFDLSTICASEQALVVDRPIFPAFRRALLARGVHFCDEREAVLLRRTIAPGGTLDPSVVGQCAAQLATRSGFEVPPETSVLVAEESGVGREFPLSIEKLAPVLALYHVHGWREGCERCMELLDLGGRGHTIAVHAGDDAVVWAFAREKPAHRILVNTPASQGAVGYSTHLRPSMTLGCGAFGGNIAADNISAEHLLLVKRVAWGKPGFVEQEADRRRSGGRSSGESSSPHSRPRTTVPAEMESRGDGGAETDVGASTVPRPVFRAWPAPPYRGGTERDRGSERATSAETRSEG